MNVGCIPSKALLAAAEARHSAAHRRFPGVTTQAGPIDFAALVAGKREIVEGNARFVDGPALDVDGRRIEAAHYLVATGAEPHVPDIPGLVHSGCLPSTTAMELEELPDSMLVLGGGYVAMEQAQLFAHLGTRVTMLVRSRLARREEPEIAEGIRDAFAADGIEILEHTVPTEVRREGDEIVAVIEDRELRAEQPLVAAGRDHRTTGLGLDAIGVDVGVRGEVLVDADMSTTNPRVWAAGDATGHPQFVYVAAKQGAIAIENASTAPGGASTIRRCHGSPSPTRRSRRPASQRPKRLRTAWRAIAGCSISRTCRAPS